MLYSNENNWDKISYEKVHIFEKYANDWRKKGWMTVEEILNFFDSIGLPMLYDYPGFYNKFFADTEENLYIVEEFCFDHD